MNSDGVSLPMQNLFRVYVTDSLFLPQLQLLFQQEKAIAANYFIFLKFLVNFTHKTKL